MDNIKEGNKKGGRNNPPTVPRPDPPKAQAPQKIEKRIIELPTEKEMEDMAYEELYSTLSDIQNQYDDFMDEASDILDDIEAEEFMEGK